MGSAINHVGFVRQSYGTPVSTGTGRTFETHTSPDVSLSEDYEEGGDALRVDIGHGYLVGVQVLPAFDGDVYVDWNGDVEDPRLKAYRFNDGNLEEVEAGSDVSLVKRTVFAYIAA